MAIKFDQLLEALTLDESQSLKESKWDYELNCGPALRKAIKDENYFEVIKQLRKAWQELFDNDKIDDWEYERGIEDLEDLQYVDDENLEDELNYLLSDFYDLCDNLRIWVPILENLSEDLDSSNDELFYKAYDVYPEYMEPILANLGYTEDNCETLEDVPRDAKRKAFSLWLKEMRERATWNDQMPTAVYDIIDLVDSSNLGESLNESYDSMWIIIPVERRYDELSPSDYLKYAKKYGTFDNQKDCWDKIDQLAPDRWDAFIPFKLGE